METIDLDEIIRRNPQFDREELDRLQKSLSALHSGSKREYRLAPMGTHRASTSQPDSRRDTAHSRRRVSR